MCSYLAIRRADIDVTNEDVSAGTIDNTYTCTAKLMHNFGHTNAQLCPYILTKLMHNFGHTYIGLTLAILRTYQCMAMAAGLTMTQGLSHLCELH